MHPRTLLLAATLAAAGIAVWPRSGLAVPRVPDSDSTVLERLPGRPGDPVQRELRGLRTALAADPGNVARAIALARRHFDVALTEGDPRHVGYAEAALRPFPEGTGAPAELLVVRAQLSQYLHDIGRALALLGRALAIDPEDPEALAWRAAIFMVKADYAAARADCARLARIASELLGTGCQAHAAAATGALGPSYVRLRAALARHPQARLTLRQWTTTLLADMAQRLGDARAADLHYRAALSLGEPDQYLLAAYAEFLLDERRATEAAALLRGWERSDTLLLQMARAAKALGSPELPRLVAMLRARYADAALRGARLHAQDEARFRLEFLGDAAGAVRGAVQNWGDDQHEAADARILMEAALAAKMPQAARPALDWLAANGYEDVRLARLASDLRRLPP